MTAVLCELLGWMAYDAGHQSLAQRYFTQALRMASDRAYGAYVLSSMSHQAIFLRHPEQALRLARAGREGNGGAPAVLAESSLLEARACAMLADRRGCVEALTRAEAAHDRIRQDDCPDWSTPIQDVIVAGYAADCWIDLGEPDKARSAIDSTADQRKGQARRQVYGNLQLARIALLEHDLEQAAALGTEAAAGLAGLASHRSERHLRDLVDAINPHADSPQVRAFLDQARGVIPASHNPGR